MWEKVFWLYKDDIYLNKWGILLAYPSLLDLVLLPTASRVFFFFLVSKIRMNLTVSNKAWACITKFQISLLDINRWIYFPPPLPSWCVISTTFIVLFMQIGCCRRQSRIHCWHHRLFSKAYILEPSFMPLGPHFLFYQVLCLWIVPMESSCFSSVCKEISLSFVEPVAKIKKHFKYAYSIYLSIPSWHHQKIDSLLNL